MIEILNIGISWGLMVLIWMVQIIIYPGFRYIPFDVFPAYHKWYALRISFLVIPLMLSEAALLVFLVQKASSPFIAYLCIGLVGIVWLSTFLVQVPVHKKLDIEKNDALIVMLVRTNWIRTSAWTMKTLVLTVFLL